VVLPKQLLLVGAEGAEDATLQWSRIRFGVLAGPSLAGSLRLALGLGIGTSTAADWSKNSVSASSKTLICTLKNGV
jgi:hypothetical protein